MATQRTLSTNYFWTWDHSTNWVLDDPGLQDFGCSNLYLKKPETYVEDYRRLTDRAARDGIGGILIWGFVRDSHGGVPAAQEVARYAASRGVRIMPGLGTTAYGGAYYEGEHEFNQKTFLAAHPDCAHVSKEGEKTNCLCPTHPDVIDWMKRGAEWLMETFEIGGVNLENGDFLTCYCDRCRERRSQLSPGEPAYFQDQLAGYAPCMEALASYLDERWITYATYAGFNTRSVESDAPHGTDGMGSHAPLFVEALPPEAICQWTLTGMVRPEPLPLNAYLDDGAPEAVYDNPNWPRGLRPPTRRSAGFLHQGSQWRDSRYKIIISVLKEGCLRAAEEGLEGISIHGEMTDRYIPWWLNYQAFSHFTARPRDTLREFADARLAPVLGSEKRGQMFIELLAEWDSGKDATETARAFHGEFAGQHVLDHDWLPVHNLWTWLHRVVMQPDERVTRSFL